MSNDELIDLLREAREVIEGAEAQLLHMSRLTCDVHTDSSCIEASLTQFYDAREVRKRIDAVFAEKQESAIATFKESEA
jgi:hypothetical protein